MDIVNIDGLHIYKMNKCDKYEHCIFFDLNDCKNLENLKKIIDNNSGFLFVCYTNFYNTNMELIKNKIAETITLFRAPIDFYFTTEFNKYVKPFTTIMKYFKQDVANKVNYMVYGTNETNIKFAFNCGMIFINLESLQIINQNDIKIKYPIDLNTCYSNFEFELDTKEKEIIILVGYPASGKSFLAKYIKNKYGHYILSLDDYILNEKKASIDTYEHIIVQNNKIIIDYFCLKPMRKKFIDIGKKHNYYIRVICINCDINLLKHNSYYRYLKFTREISDIIYSINLNLECDLIEGMNEIIKFNNITVTNDIDYYKYMF